MFFRLTHFHASLVVLAIILRPDCVAMFVQDSAVNSFWPEGSVKLSSSPYLPDIHAVGQGQDVVFADVTSYIFAVCVGVFTYTIIQTKL